MQPPGPGSDLKIHSYKHDGTLHRVWERNVILKRNQSRLIGANDQTRVYESSGRVWTTREPAITFFYADYWFNVIAMLRDDGIHYYCNISSPYTYDHEALKYIDYDLDVRVFPDMTYRLLDEDEFLVNKRTMRYPPEIPPILYYHVDVLLTWIHQRRGPFAQGVVDEWYERYLTYR